MVHQKVTSGQSINGEKHPYLKYDSWSEEHMTENYKSINKTFKRIKEMESYEGIPLVDIVGHKFSNND